MKFISKFLKHLASDSLYRNSIYLLLSSLVPAGLGFFFWIINARLFTPEQVGISAALLSSISLIVGFSLLGLNTGLIRYLSKSNRKNDQINTVISIVLLTTLSVTVIYILGLKFFSPKLFYLRENILFLILFFIIAVFSSFESIYTSSFIALRNTKFVFLNNTFKSVLKLFLPIFLVSLGSIAIFISASIGTILTAFFSIIILYKVYGFKFSFSIKKEIFQSMYKLSFGNYLASLFASLPLTLLPIMIVNALGPKQAAYYYIDAMIIIVLNSIQSAINNSLFAEGSHDEKNLRMYVIKSITYISVLLIPSILIVILFGEPMLRLFGKEYSAEGIELLRLLSISLIFTAINGTLSTILNVKHQVKLILLMCIIGPSILLTLIYLMLPNGLESLGYAWIIGEALIALIYAILLFAIK